MNGDIARSEPEPPSLPRKVTIARETQGYGFNLHGEKGIHGQFISAIDEGSPAQKNDLRVGDRVIAVNNEDVEDLAHAKVVERIRAGGNCVTLLVVDEQCDQYYKNLGLKIPQDKFVVPIETPSVAEAEQNHVNSVVEDPEPPAQNNEAENVEQDTTPVPVHVEAPVMPEEPAKETEDTTHDTEEDQYDEVIPQTTPEAKPAEVPAEIPEETSAPEQEESVSSTTTTTTASETREVLSTNGPTSADTTHTSPSHDMAAARPKPKRHEVKRATQNWKQKYEDFNKL